MTESKGAGFPLPRGATGFSRPGDAPLPRTGLRAFRAAVYTAARLAGGSVGEVREQVYPSTFHTASVLDGTAETVVLCHAHHPWVAFARERRTWYDEEFVAPPPWASAFALTGFEVLGLDRLTLPLSAVDTSVLSHDERRRLRAYGITALGGLLFNAWD